MEDKLNPSINNDEIEKYIKNVPTTFDIFQHLRLNLKRKDKICECKDLFEFYCVPCKCCVCKKCNFNEHKDHGIVKRNPMEVPSEEVDKAFEETEKLLKDFDLVSDKDDVKGSLKKIVENFSQQLIDKVNKMKKLKLNEIDHMADGLKVALNNVDSIKKKLKDYYNKTHKFFNLGENQDEYNTTYLLSYDLVNIAHVKEKQTKEILDVLKEDLKNYQISLELFGKEANEEVERILFGKVNETGVTLETKVNQTLEISQEIKDDIALGNQEYSPLKHFRSYLDKLQNEEYKEISSRLNKYLQLIDDLRRRTVNSYNSYKSLKSIENELKSYESNNLKGAESLFTQRDPKGPTISSRRKASQDRSTKSLESKTIESSDNKSIENKTIEKNPSEMKKIENKPSEAKTIEIQQSDSKTIEKKSSENKTIENKPSENKNSKNKTNSKKNENITPIKPKKTGKETDKDKTNDKEKTIEKTKEKSKKMLNSSSSLSSYKKRSASMDKDKLSCKSEEILMSPINKSEDVILNADCLKKLYSYLIKDLYGKYFKAITKELQSSHADLMIKVEDEEERDYARVIEGTNTLIIYETMTNKLNKKRLNLTINPIGYNIFPVGCRCLLLNKKVYISGGKDEKEDFPNVLIYDSERNKLKRVMDLNEPRAFHTMVYSDVFETIMVFGGENRNSVEVYDPLSNRWLMLPSMNFPRADVYFHFDKPKGLMFTMFGKEGNILDDQHSNIIEVLDLADFRTGWCKVEYFNRAEVNLKKYMNFFPLSNCLLLAYGAETSRRGKKIGVIVDLAKFEIYKISHEMKELLYMAAKRSQRLKTIMGNMSFDESKTINA
ncbi:MAG: hypothetical protein MJ252_17965 [archaeon]|nr:hypothetical protein [archaeon]